MGRLTWRNPEDGKIYLYGENANVVGKLADYEDLEEQCIEENQCGIRELLLKWKEFFDDIAELYDYRKAEEQGFLLRLPCKVGDTAWYVHRNGIDEVIIDSFIVNVNVFANVSYYIGCERFGKTLTPYKTLFLVVKKQNPHLRRKAVQNERNTFQSKEKRQRRMGGRTSLEEEV